MFLPFPLLFLMLKLPLSAGSNTIALELDLQEKIKI